MPGIVLFQTNFSSGELDPLLRARTDLEQYQNALETATNVVIQPQGGARRRDGLKFIHDFGSSFTSFKLIPFEYSIDDSYLLVVVTGRIYIFKGGVLQTNINSSGNDYLTASSITAGMIDDLNYTQAVDTLLLVHEDLQPQRLVRNSDTSWTISNLSISNIPQYDFGSGNENTWSASRGWPRTATFHESRLYFGGSTQRPNTIWGSKVADFFNFAVGTGLDDESVEATINTSQLNVIQQIMSGPDLQIFTTGAEFVCSQIGNEPITPSSFLIKRQTSLGTKPGIRVEDLDGATIFIQRQGKSIISFQYRDSTASYGTQPLSVLSSHLLKTPVALAARRASSTDETDRLYIVNGEDGSMAVYSVLASQNVVAPSRFTTDGEFIQVAVEIADTYVIVKRNINGSDVYYLERFDSSFNVDSGVSGGAASSVNIDHLEGESVQIIRDGIVEANQTVPGTPFTVTFASAATSSYQAGLGFNVEIKTMPAEPKMQGMSVQGVKKRILQVDALLYETQSMEVNGQLVPFRNFGVGVLGSPIEEFTGTKTINSLLGYTTTGQITITQSIPLKLTLLGMEYKMSVGA